MADTADFKTMYAMLKVHSANQAKEIERLQERLATPPADAALADAIKLACNYYRQAGRVGTTSQTLAKQHEAAADKIIAEALRVRAVADGVALAYGVLWHVNNMRPGYDAPVGHSRQQLTPEKAAYKARAVLRELLTNDQRGDGINRADAILSATDSEVKE